MPTSDVVNLKKSLTGIRGFDEITRGGLPSGHTTVILGGAGSGKTVFALQLLINGIGFGERGIFVAFEENTRDVIANAASFGWDMSNVDTLLFLDAGMSPDVVQTGRFDVGALLSAIRAKFAENHATRIVFDSIDVLLELLDDPFTERQELFRIQDWLHANDVTGVLTARSRDGDGSSPAKYDFLEFMADCVVRLGQYVVTGMAHRELRVAKYRGAAFDEGVFPMVIGAGGIEVVGPISRQLAYPAFTERVSSGIERLDTMLAGGYFRGSTVLITGAPGTAKSTLAAAFSAATARRGECCLYVSFDESSGEIVRNMRSIGIDLSGAVAAGTLVFHSIQSSSLNTERHFLLIQGLIDQYHPSSVVIDPLSALSRPTEPDFVMDVPQRLVNFAKSNGITMIGTSLVANSDSPESTDMNVSTIADTWMHLSFRVQLGERNRVLTIVKSRGTGHSRQAREMVLSDQGVTLADVYVAGGEVLMGTLRWEKEEALRRAAMQVRSNLLKRESELRQELVKRQSELDALTAELQQQETHSLSLMDDLGRLRGADTDDGAAT
ncbi:MAG TPA: circadian clock protein KaiC [Duganella sp.]|nr:circadian clock protein KaiC [Duganella sp.]